MTAVYLEPMEHWEDHAACVGRHPEAAPEDCSNCPVRILCLEYALEHKVTTGKWGGYSPEGRAELLRRSGGHAGDALVGVIRQLHPSELGDPR